MTGRPTVEAVQAALGAGALDCLVKPLDRTALATLLAEVFPSAVPKPRKRVRRNPPA
jgi:FixJ family two-component response regulator